MSLFCHIRDYVHYSPFDARAVRTRHGDDVLSERGPWRMGCGWGLGAGRVTKVNGPPERARLTPRRFLLSGFTRDRETRRPRLEFESTNLALAGQLSLLVSSLGLWGVRGARATQRWRPRRAARRGTRALGAHGGVGRGAGSQPRDATRRPRPPERRELLHTRSHAHAPPTRTERVREGARRGQPRPQRGARLAAARNQELRGQLARGSEWIPVMILPQVHLRKPCYDFSFSSK